MKNDKDIVGAYKPGKQSFTYKSIGPVIKPPVAKSNSAKKTSPKPKAK